MFYIGCIAYKDAPAFLFTAPERVHAGFFLQMAYMIFYYPEIGQVIIHCQTVTYMDSESIAAMIDLVRLARRRHCGIYIYAPSHKFNSYLTLSNTGKRIAEIPAGPSVQSAKDGIHRKEEAALFGIANPDGGYGMKPDRINYIGRSLDVCDIHIDDASVSRVHAAMFIIRNSLYVMDFNATNGTYINNQPVPPLTLQIVKLNDRLVFGHTPPFKLFLNESYA